MAKKEAPKKAEEVDLPRLEEAIRYAWNRQTSSKPNLWSQSNPSLGQCAVTACVVQDYIGGEIVWYEAQLPDETKESHYFNRVGDEKNGTEYDFTRAQFPLGTQIGRGSERKKGVNTREYVLKSSDTVKRYELLRENVAKLYD